MQMMKKAVCIVIILTAIIAMCKDGDASCDRYVVPNFNHPRSRLVNDAVIGRINNGIVANDHAQGHNPMKRP